MTKTSLLVDTRLIIKGISYINRTEHGLIWFILAQHFIAAFAPFVNIVISGIILNQLTSLSSLRGLLFWVTVMVSCNCAITMLNRALDRVVRTKKFLFEDKNDIALSMKAISMSYEYVENADVSSARSQMREDAKFGFSGIWRVIGGFMRATTGLSQVIISIGGAITAFTVVSSQTNEGILAFFSSSWASGLLLAIVLVTTAITMNVTASTTAKNIKSLKDFTPFNRYFFYYLNNYLGNYHAGKDVRIYDQKELILTEQMSQFGKIERTAEVISSADAKKDVSIAFVLVVLDLLVFLFIGLKSLAGLFGVGSVLIYSACIKQFISGFSAFSNAASDLLANSTKLREFFKFHELPPAMDTSGVKTPCVSRCSLEFRNVSFKYPGTEQYILKDISIRIKQGEKLAVVGENGSGKTTFIKLLCRLYDPSEGAVFLNGIDIREYDYAEYLRFFSVVFQDFTLFSQTIAQNVAASVDFERALVEERLKEAGFKERLASLDKGIDTFLFRDFEKTGIEISGGEAQKIALARALYKDAPIVVLDEPTAALDPIAEVDIYQRFNQMVGDRTCVFISHRLASCKFCDKIAVFSAGRLVQVGSHDALVDEDEGKYSQLWLAQARNYEDRPF